ncbi:MAG: carbohydrate kinase family protein [Desertimonas sp.]
MIVVAGEALIDVVVDGDEVTARPGGAPHNVARAIGRLGLPVTLLAGVSNDGFGKVLRRGLGDAGVDPSLLQTTSLPTTLAVAQLDERGAATYTFYVTGTSAPEVAPGVLPERVGAFVTGGLALVLEPLADTIVAALAALSSDTLTMLDVNCRPHAIDDAAAYRERVAAVARRADVVKASDEDLDFLVPGVAPIDGARAVLGLGAGVVLVTAGSAATTIVSRHGELRVPVPPADVVDTIGAGDTFTAGFVAWWVERGIGRPADVTLDALATAVDAAHAAAAVVVGRRGADPPTRAELAAPWT